MTVIEEAAKLVKKVLRLEKERNAAIARAAAAETKSQELEDMVDGLIGLLRGIPISKIWMCGLYVDGCDDEKYQEASEIVLYWVATEQISSLFTQEEKP